MNWILKSQQTPHTSPSRASYGVSLVRILEKTDRAIMAPHCIWFIVFLIIATVVPISQIPRCISQMSNNTLFCNKNVQICSYFSYNMCIVGYEASCGTSANFHCDTKTISMLLTLFDRSLVESPHRGAVIRTFDIFFDVKRLNKHWSYRRFKTHWCSGDVTVMSMINHSSLIILTSQCVRWRLKSPDSWLFT